MTMTKQAKATEPPPVPATKPRVCAFLQATGGAGKTTTLIALAQAINALPDRKALPVDLDPESATLARHQALSPTRLNVMDARGSAVEQLQYMKLLDEILDAPLQGYTDVLLDPGASGFRGVHTWLLSQAPFEFLRSNGWDVELHYVIPGNGRKAEAYNDLEATLRGFPGLPIVIWLNPIQEDCDLDGLPFTELPAYKQNLDRIKAIVRLPQLDSAFRHTLMRLMQHGLTYDEGMAPAAALAEEVRGVMLGSRDIRKSKAMAHMPPGLNDPLAPNRVFAIKRWLGEAIKEAGLL